MHPESTKNSALDKLSTLFSYFAVFIFIVALAFPHNPAGNWYQQFMPSIGGQQINDITFLDSLTGFAISSRNVNPDTASILKTTNRGDSWQVVFTQTPKRFSRIQFINADTGYACGGSGGGTPQIYKTTNAGVNWTLFSSFGCAYWNDMRVLSNDTIWVTDASNLCGGVFRTTNGGGSWEQKLSGTFNTSRIFMLNARTGFISNNTTTRRTTNEGLNWTTVLNEGFIDITFIDTLNGWLTSLQPDSIKKTTDGGVSWIKQIMPKGGIIQNNQIYSLDAVNKDTVWASGGNAFYGGGQNRGMLFRTINSGNNWLFQVPDTSIHIFRYNFIQFINKRNGWAYHVTQGGIHTTNGGDTTFYIGVQQISSEAPTQYHLHQNYPNPFNPRTVIPFSLKQSAYVRLIAYDITGREIQKMVNGKYSAGEYEADFIGKFTSSGVYLYRMEVVDDKTNQLYTETKKMILLK